MMERVGALETTFLGLETPTVSFVYACVIELDRPLELEALRRRIDTVLDAIPRYRQRIVKRRFRRPVWEDDREFTIAHHVREARVGGLEGAANLETLAGQLLGMDVPRDHSPWCVWTVRGLPNGRGAMIALVHHALGDGLAGLRLLDHLFGAAPAARETPRPPPRLSDLLSWRNARGLAHLLRDGLRPGPNIGINPRVVARERLFASHAVPLAEIRAIQEASGTTLNDVLLAAIAGALRRYVERHGNVAAQGVRAMVPVGRHVKGEVGEATIGNRVALALAPLPVDEADPRSRIARIHSGMHQARRTVEGGDLLVAAADVLGPTVLTATFRTALRLRAYNTIVTNVPGPSGDRHLLDARVTAITPIVNLWPHEALGFAATSYAGTLHIGIQADRVHVPDVAVLRDDLAAAFGELAGAVAHAA
ncbi:MAG TPA: wax ester/triacylglycerol synthase domain-containing protein [Kofleriaceae bacterium]|nr:wax ester/triacylglycerol synthase domain-containing protein [Kofleriaceae bacterium]